MDEWKDINRNVRTKVRNAMQIKGIDADQLASRLEWPISEICHYIEDSDEEIGLFELLQISRALDISVAYFVMNDDSETGKMIEKMFLMDCKQRIFLLPP